MIALAAFLFCIWALFSLGKWWANTQHQEKEDLASEVKRYVESDLRRAGLGDRVSELRGQSYYSDNEILARVESSGGLASELDVHKTVVAADLILGEFLGRPFSETVAMLRQRVADARSPAKV